MPTWLIVILISVLFVGFFVIGMSITLIFKGHNIDSEIATNKNMQNLGIKCAAHEAHSGGDDDGCDIGCHDNCATCEEEKPTKKEHTV